MYLPASLLAVSFPLSCLNQRTSPWSLTTSQTLFSSNLIQVVQNGTPDDKATHLKLVTQFWVYILLTLVLTCATLLPSIILQRKLWVKWLICCRSLAHFMLNWAFCISLGKKFCEPSYEADQLVSMNIHGQWSSGIQIGACSSNYRGKHESYIHTTVANAIFVISLSQHFFILFFCHSTTA